MLILCVYVLSEMMLTLHKKEYYHDFNTFYHQVCGREII